MATKSKKPAAKRIIKGKAKKAKPAAKAKAKSTSKAKAKPAQPGAPREGSKLAQLIGMLAGKGATNAELCKALGWQAHTLRAAISRLPGKIERTRVDGVTSYRMEA